MERKLIARGVLSGALAGLLAFVFARLLAEPVIDAATRYESGREAAQNLLNQKAGLPIAADGPDLFSRTVQANVGIGVGVVVFGAAVGAMFAVVYTVCLGRVGNLRPRVLALLVAGGGFVGVFLVPFLKYPANPPAIGHAETIKQRGGLYLAMVLASVALLGAALALGRRLQPHLGSWNASLVAGLAFVVAVGVVMAVLPPLGHLAVNRRLYGLHATETPLPLRDPQGTIVYPGFPADTLAQFRLYSVGAQLVLWSALGLLFGPLAERLLAPPAARVGRRDAVGQLA